MEEKGCWLFQHPSILDNNTVRVGDLLGIWGVEVGYTHAGEGV